MELDPDEDRDWSAEELSAFVAYVRGRCLDTIPGPSAAFMARFKKHLEKSQEILDNEHGEQLEKERELEKQKQLEKQR